FGPENAFTLTEGCEHAPAKPLEGGVCCHDSLPGPEPTGEETSSRGAPRPRRATVCAGAPWPGLTARECARSTSGRGADDARVWDVKDEFRRNAVAGATETARLMQAYADVLQTQVMKNAMHPMQKVQYGANLTTNELQSFNEEQIGQLYELMQEASKPNDQFNI
ncbi:succinate dehydrogenase assembly factor 3, mitochondrial, partial [Narcine bancroftii]|uniref:succinate dehydrogenase assembly factor 3, mitochondrial n=1 Tax=Narcine bancroftii TaxID=1343680 RepID=UPI003831C581